MAVPQQLRGLRGPPCRAWAQSVAGAPLPRSSIAAPPSSFLGTFSIDRRSLTLHDVAPLRNASPAVLRAMLPDGPELPCPDVVQPSLAPASGLSSADIGAPRSSEETEHTTAAASPAAALPSAEMSPEPSATAHASDPPPASPSPSPPPPPSPSEPTASTSGSRASWPSTSGAGGTTWIQPPYADALTSRYNWPRQQRNNRLRPDFLEAYPVPPGKTFNVNSFLGRKDIHGGQYLVPQERYRAFLADYVEAFKSGYLLFLTENYHQQVYKYFVELDWDWDTDLSMVMEVTPLLMDLITDVAADFYRFPVPNIITSIRTPYKVHLNFPQLLTTELLASMCRDRVLEACRARLGAYAVDWERLIDFPHGSLRLMGSRKAPHLDSDPAWVYDKAYYPARLMEGRWRPGSITAPLMLAASMFPAPHQVAAFERSPAYLDMIFGDLEAYKHKLEERRRRRAERAELSGPPPPPSPPGSAKNPLRVTLEVQPDDTVAVKVHVKSRFRTRGQQAFKASGLLVGVQAANAGPAQPEGAAPEASGTAAQHVASPEVAAETLVASEAVDRVTLLGGPGTIVAAAEVAEPTSSVSSPLAQAQAPVDEAHVERAAGTMVSERTALQAGHSDAGPALGSVGDGAAAGETSGQQSCTATLS